MTDSVADPARTLWCAELLDRLRREGFDVGMGQYLQIERILDLAGPPAAIRDLATLIGPIVARDPDEQRRFHELFDDYIGAVTLDPESDVEPEPRPRHSVRTKSVELEPPPRIPWWRRRSVWMAAGSLAVLAALILTPWGRREGPGPIIPIDTSPPADTVVRTGLAELALLPPPQVPIETPVPRSFSRLPLRLVVTAVPVLLFVLHELRRRRRRQAVAEHAEEARAPYVWPIRIPNAAAGLFPAADLAATARALRRRQRGTELAFAIEPTIRATIESFGFPAARFEAVTRPAEYLALIERATPRDHQAHYFAALAQRLALEGAFLSQYFFEHDPRVCFQPGVLRGVRIGDLARQREGDRLLIFSDGYNFLHPVRGTPLPWIELLEGWQERALITPVEPRRWGAREACLKRYFSILPTTLDGLRCAADYFDTGTRPDLSRLKERDRSLPPPPDGPGVTAAELRSALADDGLFRWLCACAVYPELHWDLTARLGDLGEVGAHTLTERNVLRLVRLRWFRDGLMPNEIRRSLLDELARLDRGTGLDTEQAARQTLARLIEHEPVELESVAGQLQRKELLQQRLYLYRDDPPARRAAWHALRREVAEEEMLRDVTVVRLLERSLPNRLALALPRWIREAVWPAGQQALGARRAVGAGLAAAVAAGAWVALPDLRPSSGRISPSVVVPALRAAVLQPNDRSYLRITVLDSAGGPTGLAGVTFATSSPAVVTVDTAGGKPVLRTGRSGSAVVTVQRGGVGIQIPVRVRPDSGSILLLTPGVFELGVLGRLLSPEPPPAPATPSSGAAPAPAPSSSASGRTSWTSCDPATVEIKSSSFGETWGVAEARRPGSAVVIGRGPGLVLVRVIHVTQASRNPLVREIEKPIDPLAITKLADIGRSLAGKASAMVALLRQDSTLRIRGIGEFVSDRALTINQNAVQEFPNDSRVLAVLASLVAQGVPRSRLEFTTRSVAPTCGSTPLPAVPTDGRLDRMNFMVVRDSATVRPTANLAVVPATLELREGEVRRLQPELGPVGVEAASVTWSSTAPLVATVNGGMVLAVSAGTTTITARYQTQVATASVTVRAANVAGVTPSPSNLGVTLYPTSLRLRVGDSARIDVRIKADPKADSPLRGADTVPVWSSSAPRIAQVNRGIVRGLTAGTARITATLRGRSAATSVRVDTARSSIANTTGVRVPPVAGQGISQATAALRKAGLSLGGIDTTVALSCTVRGAQVTGTKPAEGTIVSAGAEVRLQVLPPRDDRATVPNLLGRPLEAAKGLLVDGCLTLGSVVAEPGRALQNQARQQNQAAQQQNQAAQQPPVVVDQDPKAGSVAPLRSKVNLRLGEGSGSTGGSWGDGNQEFVQRALKALLPNYVLNPKDAVSALEKGVPRSQLISDLIGDPMFAKFDRPDGWIDGVVQLILCRKVDAKEVDTFRAEVKKLGDDGFVRQVLSSPEGRAKRSSCLGERPAASAK